MPQTVKIASELRGRSWLPGHFKKIETDCFEPTEEIAVTKSWHRLGLSILLGLAAICRAEAAEPFDLKNTISDTRRIKKPPGSRLGATVTEKGFHLSYR